MPTFSPYSPRQLRAALAAIGDATYSVVAPLQVTAWRTDEPVAYAERETGERLELAPGDPWGRPFDAAWFRFTAGIPPGVDATALVAVIDTGGELLVVDGRGEPVRGLTTAHLVYEASEERAGKSVLPLAGLLPIGAGAASHPATGLEVWADAGCNELFQDPAQRCTMRRADLAVVHPEVLGLYYDYEVLWELLQVLPADRPRYHEVLAALTRAGRLLYKGLPEVAAEAREVLRPALARRGGDPVLRFAAVGHAHLDLAWLWPLREGMRKSTRTFATALANLDLYEDYVFAASQPQQYQWIKDDDPDLYERIRSAVRAGRIEPLGALWVEADTNVSGGEALVRQVLYGKRFVREEFGIDAKTAWLPDSFGFSGALPQILAQAGVRYFTTQKLSWSLVNRFPHHSFVWRGIDGSSVLTHMLPEDEYNSGASPRSVRKAETNYRDKDVSHHALLAYGLGDGGGGPGEQHLERLARVRDLQGLSPVRQQPAAAFYDEWRREAGAFAEWVGELYLERHQGTLTTQAGVKRFNRLLELGLRELEWVATLAGVVAGAPYPRDWLGRAWREVLLYQFHDILPGSSIRRVYDEALPRYAALYAELRELLTEYDGRLAAAVDTAGRRAPYLVLNSLPWPRNDWVRLGEAWHEVHVPAMGYRVVDAAAADSVAVRSEGAPPDDADGRSYVEASPSLLENDVLRVAFAADGSISSLVDKRLGRDLITPGAAGNVLAVYSDTGDVWDFPPDYHEQQPRRPELTASAARVDGARGVVRQTYRIGHSEIVQDIALMANGARLDFRTTVRWREPWAMLRTGFAVTPHADDATFEIQFGHIRRPTHFNTSWDVARTEVAAHKWADLSQGDYGVALLNDCKYGHRIKEGVIELNLLRSVKYPGDLVPAGEEQASDEPNPHFTDQGEHTFTYSLFPHAGDHVDGRVVQASYELNVPLRATALTGAQVAGEAAALPAAASFLEVDADDIVVEAVKRAEDGDDVILRLYESHRHGTTARLRLGFDVTAAAEVDLLEEQPAPLAVEDGRLLTLVFRPFEIKTVRLTPA